MLSSYLKKYKNFIKTGKPNSNIANEHGVHENLRSGI